MKKIKKQDLELNVGDYIFTYQESSFVSNKIADFSCNNDKYKVSHIACVVDNNCVIEALGNIGIGEVVKNSISDVYARKDIKMYVAKSKLTSNISDYEYLDYLNSKIGTKYDYRNIFFTQIIKLIFGNTIFGGQHNKDQADDKYICSELASEAMNIRFGILRNWYKDQPSPIELFKLYAYFDYYEIVE